MNNNTRPVIIISHNNMPVEKFERRKIQNREAAARSRALKKERLKALENRVKQLSEENALLQQHLNYYYNGYINFISTNNNILADFNDTTVNSV